MKLTKSKPQTEAQKFHDEFNGKKKNYRMECDTMGNIILCETVDKDIIKHLKLIGFE
tara:strand:+ start:844 stop:1014 length:171 start_codon:yes stop_codon:yes gene_type:complete